MTVRRCHCYGAARQLLTFYGLWGWNP